MRLPSGLQPDSLKSVDGQTVLVTGGARGLGLASCRVLAGSGARVYIADKDVRAAQNAVSKIRDEIKGAQVEALPLDLGSQSAVHQFCDDWMAKGPPKLHKLINNAGANFMNIEPWYTDQGVAGMSQVNFLGPYTLTRRLLPALEQTAIEDGEAIIVNVVSVMHRWASLPRNPLVFLNKWQSGNDDKGEGSYRTCKHAGVVFSLMLDQLFRHKYSTEQGNGGSSTHSDEDGRLPLRAICVDPGFVHSNLWDTSPLLGKPPGSTVMKLVAAPPDDACATILHAVTDGGTRSGSYFARGLFKSNLITQAPLELLTAPFCLLDWPLQQMWASQSAATCIGSEAQAAVHDGRGKALWDAAAELAGLPLSRDDWLS